MVSDDVTRRGVMKGVGAMTGASLAGREASGARRDDFDFSEPSETSVHSAVDSTQWPQSGGTAAKTGYRPGAVGPKSTVAYRWRVDGSPTISGVVVSDSIVYASDENTLRALSSEDGSEVWTVGNGDTRTSLSTPAVDDALVYIGETRKRTSSESTDTDTSTNTDTNIDTVTNIDTNTISRHSRVLALNAATGEKVWQFEPERSASGFHSPTVAGGIVYIVGRNFGAGSTGLLYALDGTSGELLWKQETGTSRISGYEAPPVAVENGVVYLAAGGLFALDASTGETYWSTDSEKGAYRATGKNAPAVADGRLYIGRGTTTTLEARNVVDGSRAWIYNVTNENKTTEAGTWTGAAVDNDTIYAGFNDRIEQKSTVYALAVNSGTIRWQTTFSDNRLVHTPAIADGVLYTGGAALRLDDGSIRWRLDSMANTRNRRNESYRSGSGPEYSTPAIANGTVYVGGETLRAITGRT
jgi:outer membrane protein assembly factor BamB